MLRFGGVKMAKVEYCDAKKKKKKTFGMMVIIQ